ncbi:MAG: hypothetical protein ABSE20_09620 [Acetobacteraceae bacterium]|jgi:hypothetical protein
MQIQNLFAAMIASSMLLAAPAFAQSAAATKQPTQEGGGSTFLACGPHYNANPAGDPNCKQQTQAVAPSPTQGSPQAAASK